MSAFLLCQGDARELPFADESVHCCVTSPPYFGLRDYGVAGQMGLEPTPDEYVAGMVAVFREVRRVLRNDGTVFLNIGDSYFGSGKGGNPEDSPHQKQRTNRGSTSVVGRATAYGTSGNLKPKDLIGIPWMLAFALRADGWYLRSDIIWSKPNPMPESVTDRPTKAHEYIFLLSKSERYYYDAKAVAEPATRADTSPQSLGRGVKSGAYAMPGRIREDFDGTRNRRSVWSVSTSPFPGAHFATYPPALIEPCILAGSPVGGIVLDPFTGSGTTGEVAIRNGRSFVGVEINPDYVALARKRIGNAPLSLFGGAEEELRVTNSEGV